ncbi:MAG: hypothetical protein DLM50_06075 [Candidatus Meridianibacter frigidus]|nr:MAG: hypothetical protein DLM50_06075 [Candidatus Eremiobacteraeota bacterium]
MACVPPAGDTPFLAFPASGSTGNSPNIGQVIVADQTALGSGWDAVVTVSGIGSQLGGTFQPAALPLPSPNATPPFANPVYESSAFNVAVPAGSTVQVSVNNLNSTCTPVVIGSFGT